MWGWPVVAADNTNRQIETQPFIYSQYVPFRNMPEYVKGSCVLFAKWYTFREDESWGNARYIQPTRQTPYVGGMVKTNEGGGHVAVIIKIEGDTLYVIESNFIKFQVSERMIEVTNNNIRGYF